MIKGAPYQCFGTYTVYNGRIVKEGWKENKDIKSNININNLGKKVYYAE